MDKENVMHTPPTKAIHSGDNSTAPRISSENLLAGHRVLVIEHNGDEYRLRITSKDKMILTK